MKDDGDIGRRGVMSGSSESFDVVRCYNGESVAAPHDLIVEAPFVIRIDGQPYATIMRTPGEETFHAAGFCLSEGIIDELSDFLSIGYNEDSNAVEITLNPDGHKRAEKILERKNLLSLSSSGILGREMVAEKLGLLKKAPAGKKINVDDAIREIERLRDLQELHRKTWGAHAAMILDSGLETLSVSEDVGRHNALDKATGRLLMTGRLAEARICVLSSRISYEMIIKTNRAQIPVVLSASRPTALAVSLGKKLGMTLACAARKSELIIFAGKERIEG